MLRRRWLLLVLLLAPLFPLWRAVFGGESIGPYDQIRQMAPWNGPAPAQPWDVLQADGVLQFYAWRDLVLESWGRGEVPAWNPYQLAGTPLLANSQSGGFYPPHILLGVLHVPAGLAMTLLAWFHLAVAGIGTALLSRRFGASRVGATVAGLLFALSPFMLAWTALPSVITTVAWIPWVLAGVTGVFRSDRAVFGRSSLLLAVSTGMMLLAGHLQFSAYGLMAAVILLLALLASSARRESTSETNGDPAHAARPPFVSLGNAALGLLLGAMLAAAQLLPVLQYGNFSHRRGAPTAEGYQAYSASALKTSDLVSRLANPFGQGDPTEKVVAEAPFSTFWPALSRAGANYAESALTLGPITLVLLGLLALRRPRARQWVPLAAVGVVALLLALGTPLNQLLYFAVPGWSATGSPGRISVLFVLAGCALAGLALPDDEPLDRRRALMAAGAGALVALLSLVPMTDPAPQGVAPDAWVAISGASSAYALPFLAATLLALGGAWFAATHPGRGALVLLASMFVIGLIEHVPKLVRTGDASFLKTSPMGAVGSERVAVVNSAWGLDRAVPALYPPNTPTAARIHDLAGYDSLIHRDTVAALRDVNGQDPAPGANGNMMFVKRTADPAKLADAGVTRVWSRQELPQLGQPTRTTDGVLEYALPGPGRASTPNGSGQIEREGLGSLSVRATGPGTLVVRERNLPGWTAAIGGKEIPIRGDRWIELDLPDGDSVVDLRYTPPGLSSGRIVSFVALLLCIVGGVAATRAGRRSSDVSSDSRPTETSQ